MVLRESLGGEGLLKFVEFGETNYLLLRLDEKSPGCPSWWPRWPCHGGSATELPWWLQECPRSCWWPSLCCPVPTAEPTLDSDLMKREKALSLWWHHHVPCPGSSRWGQNEKMVKWGQSRGGDCLQVLGWHEGLLREIRKKLEVSVACLCHSEAR